MGELTVAEQRGLAARQLVARVLADAIAAEVKSARERLEPTIRPGEKVVGVLPTGEEVGEVQRTKTATSAVVVDEEALLAYVKRARPDEIITREEIRAAFLRHLLSDATTQLSDPDGPGLVVDPDGEVVPGIELRRGSSSYRPSVTPEGARLIRERLADLLGPLAEVLALPAAKATAPIVVAASAPSVCRICSGSRLVTVVFADRPGESVRHACPHCSPAPGVDPLPYLHPTEETT